MAYRYGVRVKRGHQNIKKYITGGVISVLAAAGMAFPAMAANDYCGASSNGCDHALANSPCAGSGGFGAFGKDNSFAGGASGDRTSYNNTQGTGCGDANSNGAAGTLGNQDYLVKP